MSILRIIGGIPRIFKMKCQNFRLNCCKCDLDKYDLDK